MSDPRTVAPTGLPFEILEPLGTGSMGTVYRARQHQLSREVALKVIRLDRSDDERMQARFRRDIGANSSVGVLYTDREGATWVLESRRRHRVMNGELPGLVSVLEETPAGH